MGIECGAFDPSKATFNVNVTYESKTQKKYANALQLLLGKGTDVTVYNYTIATEGIGTMAAKVEYKLNGKWSSYLLPFTFETKLNSLEIRITDIKGVKHTFTYNGVETLKK